MESEKMPTLRRQLDAALAKLPTVRGRMVASKVKERLSRVDAGGMGAMLEAAGVLRVLHSCLEEEMRGANPDWKFVRALHRAWHVASRWERDLVQSIVRPLPPDTSPSG